MLPRRSADYLGRAACALGHDPLKALALSLLEELCAGSVTVTAECDELVARQDVLELLFSFKQSQAA